MQPLYHFADNVTRPAGLIDADHVNGGVLHLFRLAKLLRLIRFFRGFTELQVVIKAVSAGLRSAAYVWVLLGGLMLIFSVFLSVSVQDRDVKEEFYASLTDSFLTLLLTGIMLDDIRELWLKMRRSQDLITLLAFWVLQFVAFFGLANLLIGLFCISAQQIAEDEKAEHDLRFLEKHLKGIVECYTANGQISINQTEYELIVKNTSVRNTLKQCGSDTDALLRISDTLFPEMDSTLTLQELYQVFMRLRNGAPARDSQIQSLISLVEQRFDSLESHIMPEGGFMK